MRSLATFATSLSRTLAFQISLALTIILTMFAFAYCWQSRHESLQSMVEGQSRNIAYWMTVGDIFELKRTLSFMVDRMEIRSITLNESSSDGAILQVERRSGAKVNPLGMTFKYSFPIKDNSGVNMANLRIDFDASLLPFLLSGLVGILCFFVLSYILKIRTRNLCDAIIRPIDGLVDQVNRASSARELADIRSDGTPFDEVQRLSSVIRSMGMRVDQHEGALRRAERKETTYKIARQIAHDIRSPLSALQILSKSAKSMNDGERQLILAASERIEKMASDMLRLSKEEDMDYSRPDKITIAELTRLISETVDLKSVEFGDRAQIERKISLPHSSSFVFAKSDDLQRILSNLSLAEISVRADFEWSCVG